MRLDYRTVLPEASRAMSGLEKVVESSALEPKLLELVKLRASQINGCAYCLDMHTKDARAIGEDEQRLHLVAVWREAPFFTPREHAALAWTEALTLLPETGAPDDVYATMAREFDPLEQVALTLAIVAINGWNRLAVGFRRPVGSYVSSRHPDHDEATNHSHQEATMEEEEGRLRRAPVERFAGTEHVYDLAEIARQLRAEPHPATDGHRQMTIAHHGSVALVLFDFEADGRLADHVADGLVTIHVLTGHIQVKTKEADNELGAGTLLVLSPRVAHDLYADVPSQVLLTVHMEPTT